MSGSNGSSWVAPSAWAFVVGAVVIGVSLLAGLPSALRAVGVIVGVALIVYFVARYVLAARRGEVPKDSGDEPPGGWSTQGPYTG